MNKKQNTFSLPSLTQIFRHAVLLLTLCAVGGYAAAAEKKFKVVTTFTIIQDMAQNVAGDAAVVESITKPVPKSMTTSQPRKTLCGRRMRILSCGTA